MAATGERPGVSPAFRWLSQQGFYFRAREKTEYTHTLFNGGLLNIPDAQNEEFLERIAADMDAGHDWFINEVATPVTALYVDCDFEDARPPEDSADFCDFVARVDEEDLAACRAEIDRKRAAVEHREREYMRAHNVGTGAGTGTGTTTTTGTVAIGGGASAAAAAAAAVGKGSKAARPVATVRGANDARDKDNGDDVDVDNDDDIPPPPAMYVPVGRGGGDDNDDDGDDDDDGDGDDDDDDDTTTAVEPRRTVSSAKTLGDASAASKAKTKKKTKNKRKRAREIDLEVTEVGARMPKAFLFRFVQALQQCVFDYFPGVTRRDDKRLTCIVLTTPTDKFTVETTTTRDAVARRTVRTHRIVRRKCGIHIVWPWLCATQADMLDLREGFLRAVGRACGDRPATSNRWDAVIDKQIYLPTPSLRMVNCDKIDKCDECKRSSQWRIKCARCQGAPPQANRPYRPEFSFSGDGQLTTHAAKCLQNVAYMLRLCTIRRIGLKPDDIHVPKRVARFKGNIVQFAVPADAPRYDGVRFEYRAPNNGDKSQATARRKGGAAGAADGGGGGLQAAETRGLSEFSKRCEVRQLDVGSVLFRQIEEFLRSAAMHKRYRNIVVSSVVEYEYKSSRYYKVRVTGAGSHYCQNVDRDHGQVRVYFHLTRSCGCQQRCFCKCESAKPGQIAPAVLCKNYASPGVSLTRALDVALFPRETAAIDLERRREAERPALMAVEARPDSAYMFPSVSFATNTSAGAASGGGGGGGGGAAGAAGADVSEWETSAHGTDFDFDARDPDCAGMRSRPTPPSSAEIAAEDERRRRHNVRRMRSAGDGSIVGKAPPPGKHLIPTDAPHAPANVADARRMLWEAQQRQQAQVAARYDRSMFECFTGDFASDTI